MRVFVTGATGFIGSPGRQERGSKAVPSCTSITVSAEVPRAMSARTPTAFVSPRRIPLAMARLAGWSPRVPDSPSDHPLTSRRVPIA